MVSASESESRSACQMDETSAGCGNDQKNLLSITGKRQYGAVYCEAARSHQRDMLRGSTAHDQFFAFSLVATRSDDKSVSVSVVRYHTNKTLRKMLKMLGLQHLKLRKPIPDPNN